MAYTEEKLQRMIALIRSVELTKEHEFAAATYRDLPALKELDQIVRQQLAQEQPCDQDTLEDSIFAVRYLGDAYESMWRIAYAETYYQWLFTLYQELYQRFGEKKAKFEDDFYIAMRIRNYYQKDDCEDLLQIAKEIIGNEQALKIQKRILEDFHPLKHDSVELSEAYLSVIDAVEQEIDQEYQGTLHPFEWNQVFQKKMLERGIEWHSIIELNPGYRFD